MNMKNTILALCAFAASLAVAAPADDARLSEIGAEQIRIQNETQSLVESLEHDLRSEEFDTAEMKELRKKIADLKEQIRLAETELRRQFEQVPAIQERAKAKNANFARLRELYNERTAIYAKREAAQKPAAPEAEKPAPAAPAEEAAPAAAKAE